MLAHSARCGRIKRSTGGGCSCCSSSSPGAKDDDSMNTNKKKPSPDPEATTNNKQKQTQQLMDNIKSIDAQPLLKRKLKRDLVTGAREALVELVDGAGMEKLQGSEKAKTHFQDLIRDSEGQRTQTALEQVKSGELVSKIIQPDIPDPLKKTAVSFEMQAKAVAADAKQNPNKFQAAALPLAGDLPDGHNSPGMKSSPGGGGDQTKLKPVETKTQKMTRRGGKTVGSLGQVLIAKQFIGGVIKGDVQSLILMGAMLGGDKVANKLGGYMAKKGASLAETGKFFKGGALKIAGPLIASATLGMSIYNLVGSVNSLKSITKACNKNRETTMFLERHEADCAIDKELAIANVIEGSVDVALGVATIAVGIMYNLGFLTVSVGPIGLAIAGIGILISVGFQIYSAFRQMDKVDQSIGLRDEEKRQVLIHYIFGLDLPAAIQAILDRKETWNSIVAGLVSQLEILRDYQRIVAPSGEKRCSTKSVKDNSYLCFFYVHEWHSNDKTTCYKTVNDKCFIKYDSHSRVDFREVIWRPTNRAAPDRPRIGKVYCSPPGDDEDYAYTYSCVNAISVEFRHRVNGSVLYNMGDGEDIVYADDIPSFFVVQEGEKFFQGGAGNDVFLLAHERASGVLDGGGGVNTLAVNSSVETGSPLFLYILQACPGSASLTPWYGAGRKNPTGICATRVQNIIGRKDLPDKVTVGWCGVLSIDLQGGGADFQQAPPDFDYIELLLEPSCTFNTDLNLYQQTRVFNHGSPGTYRYHVLLSPGISLRISNRTEPNSTHIVLLSKQTGNIWNERFLISSLGDFEIRDSANGTELMKLTRLPNVYLLTSCGIHVEYNEGLMGVVGRMEVSTIDSNSTKRGLVRNTNIVVVTGGTNVTLTGGEENDIFVLRHGATGAINGEAGYDTVIVEDGVQGSEWLEIDLRESPLLKYQGDDAWFRLDGIEAILGREGRPDRIYFGCGLDAQADGRGGNRTSRALWDEIIYPRNCSQRTSLIIQVPAYTTVKNYADTGSYRYDFGSMSSGVEVNMSPASATFHTYKLLRQSIESVRTISYHSHTSRLEIRFKGQHQNLSFVQTIPGSKSEIITADISRILVEPIVMGIITRLPEASNETISGLKYYPNKFEIHSNSDFPTYLGGNESDFFFVASGEFTGNVLGEGGFNSLSLSGAYQPQEQLLVDFRSRTLHAAAGTTRGALINFEGIQHFVGRPGLADTIYCTCEASIIDSNGGRSRLQPDNVLIPGSWDCTQRLEITLQPNLVIRNEAKTGEFVYRGNVAGGSTELMLNYEGAAEHIVMFDFDFTHVSTIKQSLESFLHVWTQDGGIFKINYLMDQEFEYQQNLNIVFRDGLELKIGWYGENPTVCFGELNIESPGVEDSNGFQPWVEHYKMAAKRTGTNIMAKVGNGAFVSIGGGSGIDILSAVPGLDTYIFGNGANDTVARIPLHASPVHLVSPTQDGTSKLLDLSPAIAGEEDVFPNLTLKGSDLQFDLKDQVITIRDALENNHFSSWSVLLRAATYSIVCSPSLCYLKPPTILINPNVTRSLILSPRDLDRGTRIVIQNHTDVELQALKHNDSLVLSNVYSRTKVFQEDLVTVVVSDYYLGDNAAKLEARNVGIDFQGEGAPSYELTQISEDETPAVQEVSYEFHKEVYKQVLHRSTVDQPKRVIQPPERTVPSPEAYVREPGSWVRSPARRVKSPDSGVKPPAGKVKTPRARVKPPQRRVKPPMRVKEPNVDDDDAAGTAGV